MFDANEASEPTFPTSADCVQGGADMVHVFAVEQGKGLDCRGEDLRWKRDFESGRCERVYAPNSSFVERDGEALFDVAFPEEFEDLVIMRSKREDGGSGSTVLLHNLLVI